MPDPPPRRPSRRSDVLTDAPLTVAQAVYAWATDVLRWENAQGHLGAHNPLPRPGDLVIDPVHAWEIANRDRVDVQTARRTVYTDAADELIRILAVAPSPPARWAATERRVRRLAASGGWLGRLLGS